MAFERHTHEHENTFPDLVFLPPLSDHMNLSCLCNHTYALKLNSPFPLTLCSKVYFYRCQMEPVHKFQSDAFLHKFKVHVFDSIQGTGASSEKQTSQSPNFAADNWRICIEGMIHHFMHALNFCFSKQEGAQDSTCMLRSETQKYIIHMTNKISLLNKVGIIRKCSWAWSCWLKR